MRYIIIAIFILGLNSVAFSQSENVIYKKVIDEYVLKNRQPNSNYSSITLIVLEKPNYMRKLEVNEFSRFKGKYKKLDEGTFTDFVAKNKEGLHMGSDKYPDITIVMVNQEQSKNRKELLKTYPNWNRSVLEFSNIGFNKEKDQAFVYYGFDSGPGVGGGIYIVFEKKRKKWKRKATIPAWAA
ncbi:MAG: hypothetical protein PVF73_02040 [Bacteroidales bacterium]|jgi:hypothetical protein